MRLTILILLAASLIGCDKQKSGSRSMEGKGPATTPSSAADPTGDSGAITANDSSQQSSQDLTRDHELRILHWNIESGGNDPGYIADRLMEFVLQGDYHVLALSEVDKFKVYKKKFETLGESGQWKSILGESGANDGRESDRLMIFFDSTRLRLIESKELTRHGEFNLNTGRHRSPLVANFECRQSKEQFLLIQNHLARGNAEFRSEQAAGLREFARDSSIAAIAVGDYNFDYVFKTRQGNDGFVEFLRDGVWKWIEPDEPIDTNWFDPEPDGIDNYPGSMLDFTFVAGKAKDWDVTSKVIVRDGDFPDDERKSDHRPVEVIVRY